MTRSSPRLGCSTTWRSRAARCHACSRIPPPPCRLPRCGSPAPTSASSTSWRAPHVTSRRATRCRRSTACASRFPTAGGCCGRRTRSRSWYCASKRRATRRSAPIRSKSKTGSGRRASRRDAGAAPAGLRLGRRRPGGRPRGRSLARHRDRGAGWAATVAGGDVYLAARDLARLVQGIILLVSLTWGVGNLYIVYRAIGSVQLPRRLGDLEIVEAVPQRVLLGGTLLAGVAFGLILALGTGDWWLQATLAARPPRFGIADPVLHRDLGYYVAQLPWALTSRAYALLATSAAAVVVALLYLGIGSLHFRRWRPVASAHARLHLGVLLAALALTLTWGAALDPAETVAGLHGTLDSVALQIRLPGAGLVVALGILVAVASLVWGLREQATLLVGSWAALLATSLAVYLVLPGLLRSGRAAAADALEPALQGERRRLEQLAFGTEWLEERGPPG